ncbi:quinone oxidoreductase family protein [Amnibacterium endophyticum]|uniref:Quinone oxidoreductase family protein n=1 Tax=Amnibacterium endophyticum TaxID=2109337 RepID=A0ABW4LBJ0_9MICO
MAERMRVVRVERTGGPEVLLPAEEDVPTPGEGELLVELAATGVNFVDVYRRSGAYPIDLPHVPGTEGAGRVAAVGPGVTGFRAGDAVATAEGRRTYAGSAIVPAAAAAHVPAGVDLETAAALPLQGLTAHYLVTSVHAVADGTTLLVHAGAGGVGLLLIQLAKARGATVLATVGGAEKAELARGAGADVVLDYDGFADRVRERTGGRGVDVVYDGVGAATWEGSLAALRPRGLLALFGAASGPVPPIDPAALQRGGSLVLTRPTMGDFLQTPEERSWRYGELFDALASGALDVRIGARFPLDEAADAHRALEGRRTTGKVLLLP